MKTLADRIVEELRKGGFLYIASETWAIDAARKCVERVLAETPPLDTPIPVDFKVRRERLSPTPIIEETPPREGAVGRLWEEVAKSRAAASKAHLLSDKDREEVIQYEADLRSILDALEGAGRALEHIVYRDHSVSQVCDGCAEAGAALAALRKVGVTHG